MQFQEKWAAVFCPELRDAWGWQQRFHFVILGLEPEPMPERSSGVWHSGPPRTAFRSLIVILGLDPRTNACDGGALLRPGMEGASAVLG